MEPPIFIEGEELFEKPDFEDTTAFTNYLVRVAEGRDIVLVTEHPHDEDQNILSVYIGTPEEGIPTCRICTE